MIPDRERGYSIDADTATVHERYQDHAPRAMRTSALGVSNILNGREAVACEVCFPAPKPVKRGKAKEEPEAWGDMGSLNVRAKTAPETLIPRASGYVTNADGQPVTEPESE